MNRNKEKPYLEFGGNAFYINLDSILEAIKVDSADVSTESFTTTKPEEVKEIKSKKSTKKEEISDEQLYKAAKESMEVVSEQIIGLQVDISKWEVLRSMIDTIMMNNTEIDDKLGMAGLNNSSSIPFKIAFNTLLKYNILQQEE